MFIVDLKTLSEVEENFDMHYIWCNLPEIWKRLNSKHDVSDLGNIRIRESGLVLHRHVVGPGYAGVYMHGNSRAVHTWVLKTFIPKPSPMFNMCDHISRDRSDPRLINLRWSNVVLNALNKEGVRGYRICRTKKELKYRAHLKLLGMLYLFTPVDTPELARAEYEYYLRRAFALIESLCSRNMHWKFQRLILEYWIPFKHGPPEKMKWQRDPEFGRLPLCGRLC